MALDLEYFKGPFQKVWSMVGRSLVTDADGRQVVRPGAEFGGLDWSSQKDDWEKLAPIMAGAPLLMEVSERLAQKFCGPGVKYVDGRIAIEPEEVADFLAVLDEIKAAAPKIKPAPEQDDEPEAGQAPQRYRR